MRRLTTEQLNSMVAKYNFNLEKEYYSNQYFGAIDWITQSDQKFILELTNPLYARDRWSRVRLRYFRAKLLFLRLLRRPTLIIARRKKLKNAKHYFLLIVVSIFYPFSQLVNIYIKNRAEAEWKIKKTQKNGSEMYLYYTRFKK